MADVYKDIGIKLKTKRESRKLSLDDISEETKVSVDYLAAIESGNMEAFPSNVYYDMFTRSYAKELDIDPEELFEELKIQSDLVSPDSQKVDGAATDDVKPEESNEISNGGNSLIKFGIWGGGIVIVIFIAFVVWSIISREPLDSSDHESTDPIESVTNNPDPESIREEAKVEIDLPEYKPVQTMSLKVLTKDSCWVMVLADGDTVLNRNLPPGAVRSLSADYRFLISAGNPNALNIHLDGALLGPLSEGGRPYRNREINQLNKNDFLAQPKESGLETP